MKPTLLILLSLCFTLGSFAQESYLDSNFKDTTGAKNLKINGLREGKWAEFDNIYNPAFVDTAIYCHITTYKNGKPIDVVRNYRYRTGKLLRESPYANGEKNGIEKEYFESGELLMETPYTNGLIN